MKKLFVSLVASGLCLMAQAEGYQVNTFSARQQGMGQTGVSQVLGAESMIFNPAALSLMPTTMDLNASLSGISSKVTATNQMGEFKTSNKVSTPFNISAAFRINEKMAAGITLYTPYGSSIDWGLNWPGAALNQAVDLKVFEVQPTFSWRFNDHFSVGAGMSIAWGSVDLHKGLVASSSMDALTGLLNRINNTQLKPYGHVSPASASLVGSSRLALGFNVGVLYKINEQWSVGASYRSKLNMHVEAGDVTVSYADQQAQALLEDKLKNLNYTNFEASMPCPYILTVGASWRVVPRVLLAADIQLNGWGTYKKLDIAFADQSAFDQHLIKDYHNALTYHLGAEVKCTQRLDARAGLMIDTSPCNKEYYNPETPAATKLEPSLGITFRPIEGLSVNLSVMYVHSMNVNNATGRYDDFIAPIYNQALQAYDQALSQFGMSSGLTKLPNQGTFSADYRIRAIVPGIGISYAF